MKTVNSDMYSRYYNNMKFHPTWIRCQLVTGELFFVVYKDGKMGVKVS